MSVQCDINNNEENDSDDIHTFWRTFVIPEKQKLYAEFRIAQFLSGSSTSFSIFMVFYTIIFIFRYLRILLYPGDRQIGQLFQFAIIFGLIFSFLPGWIVIYALYKKCDLDKKKREYLSFLKIRDCAVFSHFSYVDFMILSFTTFWAVLLIARSLSGPCQEHFGYHHTIDSTSDCNPGYSLGILPQDTVLVLVLGVSSSQALLKGSCWAVILLAWFIQLAAVVTSFVLLKSLNASIVPQILVVQLVVLFAHENQLLLYYLGLLHQKRSLLDSLAKNNQKVAAEEHTKEIQYLIANTAHDLKTPLQVLDMGADDIRKRLELLPFAAQTYSLPRDERAAILETTGTIASTVVFMSMTINRVLDFSKVSHNIKLVPAYETINLAAVMEWPASILRSLEGRVSIIIDAVPSNISHSVITDKGWLTENLLCLFSNAIKYSSVGYVTVRCYLLEGKSKLKVTPNSGTRGYEVHTRSAENSKTPFYICVEVEDTGIGIPLETRSRLFSPFQQAQRMTTGGTGLGLYSLRKRLEALGGDCGIKNRHDKKEGSCFWFTFPYRPDHETSSSDGTSTPVSKASFSLPSSHNVIPEGFEGIRQGGEGREGREGCEGLISRRSSTDERDERSSDTMRLTSAAMMLDCIKLEGHGSSNNLTGMGGLNGLSDRSSASDRSASSIGRYSTANCCGFSRETSILLVDDSMTILKMCSRALIREGFRVTTADNGSVALNILRDRFNEFEVILTDLQMPIMDGLEFIRRVREYELSEHSSTSTATSSTTSTTRSTPRSTPSATPVGRADMGSFFPVDASYISDDDSKNTQSIKYTINSIDTQHAQNSQNSLSSPNILQSPSLSASQSASKIVRNVSQTSLYCPLKPKNRRHIVIGMSANSDDETRLEALSVGMDCFIAKPFNVDRFCDVLIHVRATWMEDGLR